MTAEQRASARAWSEVTRLVLEGRISPEQGATILELRREILRLRRRRLFWNGFRDGLTLAPLRRWLAKRFT